MTATNDVETNHMMLALQLYSQSILKGAQRMTQAASDAREMILARRRLYHVAGSSSANEVRAAIEGRINALLTSYNLELRPSRGPVWRIQLGGGSDGEEILVPR